MKTKTLAMLVAGTIVVGVGAAIAIATPASLKHNSATGFFDDIFSTEPANTTTSSTPPDSRRGEVPNGSLPTDTASNSTDSSAINVQYDVPLISQQTGMSCWAAGAAMLVAWQNNMSVDPSEIANATGYWAQYKTGLDAEDTQMFKIWGMTPEPGQSYTVEAFEQLLKTYGPLWVASAEPGPHIRVVTGLSGDGTPDGTIVHINDPWEKGMDDFRLPNAGSMTTETYSEFTRKQAELVRSEMKGHPQGIYIAHLKKPIQ